MQGIKHCVLHNRQAINDDYVNMQKYKQFCFYSSIDRSGFLKATEKGRHHYRLFFNNKLTVMSFRNNWKTAVSIAMKIVELFKTKALQYYQFCGASSPLEVRKQSSMILTAMS